MSKLDAPAPEARWPALAVGLHWLAAVLVLALVGLGLAMVNLPFGAATRFDLYQWHKSAGVMVGAILLVRLLRRLSGRTPPAAGTGWLERSSAAAVHWALALVPLALVATGILLAGASVIPVPVTLLGGFEVPLPGVPDLAAEDFYRSLHHALAFGLVGLIAIHVAAALWHHLVRKDDVLARMLPLARRRRVPGRAVLPKGAGAP